MRYLWQSVSLADILLMQGQWDEAETRFRKLHEHLLHRVGPRHPMTLTAAHYPGQVSLERGDLGREHLSGAGAVAIVQQCAEQRRRRGHAAATLSRSEEHTSDLQSLMRISSPAFCLKT